VVVSINASLSTATPQSMLPITSPMIEAINMPTSDLVSQSAQLHSPMQPPPLFS